MKPPIPYFGGKTTLAPAIADLFPAHEHYVEPYCGSLAVLLAKPTSPMETVNDLDGHLMTFWRVLRDRGPELERVCALTPHSRAEYRASYDLDDVDELEVARRVWVQLSQARSGKRRSTGWRHFQKAGGQSSMPNYLAGYVGRMHPAAERLRQVSLECMPALDLIAKYGQDATTLLYIDPPYFGETRGKSPDGYAHEMRGEADHRELAEALNACKSAVVVSGYPSDLYDRDLFAGWDRHTMTTGTGQGANSWQSRTEVLWSNRPIGQQRDLFADLDGAA